MGVGVFIGLMAADATNVLIVEDNQLLRWCITNCLQQGGFAVTAVNSVQEAIQLNGSLKPDVLITDMRLGGGTNGFEVLQEVRKRYPGTPALLVSAEADSDLITRAQAAGFDKVIEKPCEMAQVVAAVRSAICPLDGSVRKDSVKGGGSNDHETVSGLRQTAGSDG
jgi:CheY-like chemotaxis protein